MSTISSPVALTTIRVVALNGWLLLCAGRYEFVDAKACYTAFPNVPAEHLHQTTLFRLPRSCTQRLRHVVMLYFPQHMSLNNAPLEVIEGSHLFAGMGVKVRIPTSGAVHWLRLIPPPPCRQVRQ